MKPDASPTARALLTLELIQGSPGITADQLAAKLGVSARAARRYARGGGVLPAGRAERADLGSSHQSVCNHATINSRRSSACFAGRDAGARPGSGWQRRCLAVPRSGWWPFRRLRPR
jgi:hypothetical protein